MINKELIKAARGKLTQEQAANVIGASVRTWEAWEAGVRNMPPAKYTLFLMLTASPPAATAPRPPA